MTRAPQMPLLEYYPVHSDEIPKPLAWLDDCAPWLCIVVGLIIFATLIQ